MINGEQIAVNILVANLLHKLTGGNSSLRESFHAKMKCAVDAVGQSISQELSHSGCLQATE
jgi:hypothetical protein